MKWYQLAGGILAACVLCGCSGGTQEVKQTNKSLTLCVDRLVNDTYAKGFEELEYICDFIISIRLCSRHDYYKDQNQTKRMTAAERKVHIARAKEASPRKVEAVYLKDCYGIMVNVVYFDYYPKYETFIATDKNGNPLV